MKKLYTILLAFTLIQSSFAQESTKQPKTPAGGRPNIPSDLVFEFGFNMLNNRPEDIKTKFFGSRTFNIYYQYPFAVGGKSSGFTLNPGIGIGTDRFAFDKGSNLFNNPVVGPESSVFKPAKEVFGTDIILEKNIAKTTYVEVPIDLTYHVNRTNYSKGFRVSLGAKVGYLTNAQTVIKYNDKNKLTREVRDIQNFGLEKIRYGVTLKAGSPGFYAWGYLGLNNLFQDQKGPFKTEASQISFGLAFKLF
jgi:hypothetical protein